MTIREEIVRYFAGELDAREAAALRARLRQDDEARAEYDALAELVYAAAESQPPRALSEALWQRIEAEVDAPATSRAASGAAQAAANEGSARRRWLWMPWFGLAAAAALALLLVLWLRGGPGEKLGGVGGVVGGGGGAGGVIGGGARPRVQYRGAPSGSGGGSSASGSGAARSGDPRLKLLDVEVYAISRVGAAAGTGTGTGTGAGTARRFAAPRLLGDGAAVGLDDYIQLRYRSDDASLRYAYVFGLDQRRQALAYYPRPGDTRPLAVGSASAPRALGHRSIRLAHRHRRGALTVVALFSSRPLSHAAVAAALAPLKRGAAGHGSGSSASGGIRAAELAKLSFGNGVRVVTRRFVIR